MNQYFRRLLRSPGAGWSSPGAGWSSPVSNASRFLCLCVAWMRVLSVGGSPHPSLAGRGGVVRAAEEDGGSERAGKGSYGDVPGHVSMWHYSMPRGGCACMDRLPFSGKKNEKKTGGQREISPALYVRLAGMFRGWTPVPNAHRFPSIFRRCSNHHLLQVRLWPRSECGRRGSTCFSHQEPPPSFFQSVNF